MALPLRSALALAISALVSNASSAADYAALSRDEAAAAVARGATIVHDYGSFAWVANSGRGENAKAVYSLDLGGRTFDPASDGAARASAYGSGKALRLVQFDGPTQKAWLEALAADGVTVVQYIPPFSYVVWADAASLASAKSRSTAVRFAGDFLPDYKTVNVAAGLVRGERHWHVMLYRGANLDTAALQAGGARVGDPQVMDHAFSVVDAEGDAAAIQALAQLPGVYAVRPVPRDGGLRGELVNQMSANNLGGNNLPVPGYLAWLTTVGYKGTGVKVADVDGGVYDTHPDLVNRMLPCVGDTCGGSATDAHGTHTSGIIAGDGSSGTVDSAGFRRGLGVAPGAKLIEQLYSPTFTQAGGMLKLMRQSHDNGADLSSNSWGPAASPEGYDDDTRQVDVGTRDTKPDVAGDQPLTYVLSIMNGNGGTSTQGTPDEAKNTITVGSTKGQTAPGVADPDFNDVSSNSGAGPALDGRRIPHVVAPGCDVDSTISATGYGLECGTSMASPHVSGAVSLFIEKYRATHLGASPSTALIKAAIIAAAQDLQGHRDADGGTLGHRPDNKQGWGRIRTDWLLGPTPTLYYDQDTRTFTGTGDEWATTITQKDPAKPVQIVLVWTDAPGHGLGGTTPAWNNNLDLVADVGVSEYKGNVFGANGWSATGGTADGKNNVESVILDPAAASAGGGTITLRVAAANITSNALPNSGGATDQDFALVCVNCEMRPDYTLSSPARQQSLCTAEDDSTTFGVEVGSVEGYDDPVALSLDGVPAGASGSVSPASVTPPGTATATFGQLAAAAPGEYTVKVHAVSTSSDRDLPLMLTLADAPPAAPSLTAPADAATDVAFTPAFTWAASPHAADYVLEVATDAAFANIVFTSTGADTSVTPEQPLASNRQHWWRVRPANVCGTGDDSAVHTFTTRPAPGDCATGTTATAVFSDNVENGTNGWATSAGTGSATWAISTARPSSGTRAWLAQDRTATSDQRLTSPAIALPDVTGITLQFMSDQSIESNGNACWDGGFLEISTNGGTTFTAIPAAAMLTDPYDGPLDDANPAGGKPAWCGDPQAYLRSVVSLDAYAGQSVKLRFRMTTDSAVGRLPHGWYVDDIKVQTCNAAPPDVIFANGFE